MSVRAPTCQLLKVACKAPLHPGDQAEGDLPSQGRARRCELHSVHDPSLTALRLVSVPS